MRSGVQVFLLILISLGASWCGLVLLPVIQLGNAKQSTVVNSQDLYPVGRSGEANQGLQVYRATGCAACHTEQVRQEGVACEVCISDAGTNKAAVLAAAKKINSSSSDADPVVLKTPNKDAADAAVAALSAAGAKVEVRIVATGPDITFRNWGMRRSVAADFLFDAPVQPGSLRAGPDLANIGARKPDINWQLLHLYSPQSVVKGSPMPPFRYLFELQKIGRDASPDALAVPKELAPPAGYEIVPTESARQLAAYLLSLRANVPLYEAPVTPVSSNP